MKKTVTVTVCDRGAIYVDDIRITNRNTKWGLRKTLSEFSCPAGSVVQELSRRGYTSHIRNIDTVPYTGSIGRAS